MNKLKVEKMIDEAFRQLRSLLKDIALEVERGLKEENGN